MLSCLFVMILDQEYVDDARVCRAVQCAKSFNLDDFSKRRLPQRHDQNLLSGYKTVEHMNPCQYAEEML
jgi:hypothetical protein